MHRGRNFVETGGEDCGPKFGGGEFDLRRIGEFHRRAAGIAGLFLNRRPVGEVTPGQSKLGGGRFVLRQQHLHRALLWRIIARLVLCVGGGDLVIADRDVIGELGGREDHRPHPTQLSGGVTLDVVLMEALDLRLGRRLRRLGGGEQHIDRIGEPRFALELEHRSGQRLGGRRAGAQRLQQLTLGDVGLHLVLEALGRVAVGAQHLLVGVAVKRPGAPLERRHLAHRLGDERVRHCQMQRGRHLIERRESHQLLQRLAGHRALDLGRGLNIGAEHLGHLGELAAIGLLHLRHLDLAAAHHGDRGLRGDVAETA